MRASNALKSYIATHDKTAVVQVIDALEYVSHTLNKTVSDGYVFLAKKLPKLYGSVYNTANRDTTLNSLVTKITGQMTKKLIPLILEFRPDVIVTAHPFAAEMASNLKRDYRVPVEVVCIITDFAPHKTYINEKIDAYVVSSAEMVDAVEAYGVPRNKIHALGIPIDTAFYERYDREALLVQMQLDPKLKTVLIMAGSFGVTDILKIYQSISEIKVDFQVIVITGKNQKLYDAFEELLSSSSASAGKSSQTPKKGRARKSRTPITRTMNPSAAGSCRSFPALSRKRRDSSRIKSKRPPRNSGTICLRRRSCKKYTAEAAPPNRQSSSTL